MSIALYFLGGAGIGVYLSFSVISRGFSRHNFPDTWLSSEAPYSIKLLFVVGASCVTGSIAASRQYRWGYEQQETKYNRGHTVTSRVVLLALFLIGLTVMRGFYIMGRPANLG